MSYSLALTALWFLLLVETSSAERSRSQMMKFGMLSASVLLMALTGCTTNASEDDVGAAPGSWVNAGGSGPSSTGGSGPVSTGGGPVAGGATGTGGYGTAGTGAGGESTDCNQVVADCYSQAYACCGQGADEQCEMMAGNCASIICTDPYPYPLECHDYLIPVGEGVDEIQAFELAVNTCSNLGLSATSAELLELGVFVTCCPDTSGGGVGTGGTSWGTGGTSGGYAGAGGYAMGGYAGESTGAGGYAMGGYAGESTGAGGSIGGTGSDESTGAGGYSTGGTGIGGTGVGGSGPVIPGFCIGIGGEGGFAGAGGTGMGGFAGEGGEGGFATGGMPAD